MHKLSLEKAKEPEIKLPTFTGSWIEQGNPRVNIYFCFIDYDKAFDCVYHNKLLKILKEMNYQAIWPVSWETYMQSQEATVRTGHGTTDWFKTGTGIWQNCILSPCLFNFYAEFIMLNARLESILMGKISISSDMQMAPHLWQKVKRD